MADDFAIAPGVRLFNQGEGVVQITIAQETWILTLGQADEMLAALAKAIASARATETLIRSQPDGLARMGSNLFASA